MLPVCPSLVSPRPQRRVGLPAMAVLWAGSHLLVLLVLLLLLALLARPAQAQVYASAPADDEAAPLVLSNFASDDTPRLLIDAPPSPPAGLSASTPPAPLSTPASPAADESPTALAAARRPPDVPAALLPWFRHVGQEQALPVSLLLAVAAAESGFNPRARSPKGAQGLMQLMPGTARELGVRQVWSVGDNLRGGASYLRGLLQRFSGDLSLALAAYNAGEGAVQRAGNRIPEYDETRLYVPKVMAWQRHYARHDARHDARPVTIPPTKSAPSLKKSPSSLKTTTASADAPRIRTP